MLQHEVAARFFSVGSSHVENGGAAAASRDWGWKRGPERDLGWRKKNQEVFGVEKRRPGR